jgi:hypothetical protein
MAVYPPSPVGLAQLIVKVVLGVMFVGSQLSIVGALHSTDTITSGGDNTRSGYQSYVVPLLAFPAFRIAANG